MLIFFNRPFQSPDMSRAATTTHMIPSLLTTAKCLSISSMSLNRFNNDDEALGNFDEDGSFIGDYVHQEESEAKNIENQLKILEQIYNVTGEL